MVSQVGQGTMQLLLEQRRAFVCGGGGLLAYAPVRGTRGRGLGADSIAPLTMIRCA